MAKPIQLTIPEPCHENWDYMTPAEKGRFCNACCKQVVDFTGMSDAQVAAFFKKPSAGSVCGRFMQDQLERDMAIPKKRIPWIKYFFQFAIPAFLTSAKVSAQGKVMVATRDTSITPIPKPVKTGESVDNIKAATETIINGKIVDAEGRGIGYASVFFKGTYAGTVADSAGNFRLSCKGDQDSVVIVGSYVGFTNIEKIVAIKNEDQPVLLQLAPANFDSYITLGVVVRTTKKKRTFPVIQAISDTVSKKFKIFPNPVEAGASLSIECNQLKDGYYSIVILDISGKQVYRREMWIDSKARLITIEIPAIPANTYFLRMTSKESGKSSAQKIIIR